MTFALACASHTPVMYDRTLADGGTCDAVRVSFEKMRDFVEDFDPEVIIQFGPDHFNGFNYSLMPSFCLASGAESVGDWSLPRMKLPVPEEFSLELLDHLRSAEFDIAQSYSMMLDHGFVQMWSCMFEDVDRYPLLPIFINSAAPPLPKYKRVRLLGQAVGEFAKASGKRVLFAASGGLSHDPPIARIGSATGDTRKRLLGTLVETAEDQVVREARVAEFGREVYEGRGKIKPLNPEWDHKILDLLEARDWDAFDALKADEVVEISGAAANEILCWVAAASAMDVCAPYRVVQKDYQPAPGWIAGVGHLAAVPDS